jgi:hypothetical protein
VTRKPKDYQKDGLRLEEEVEEVSERSIMRGLARRFELRTIHGMRSVIGSQLSQFELGAHPRQG